MAPCQRHWGFYSQHSALGTDTHYSLAHLTNCPKLGWTCLLLVAIRCWPRGPLAMPYTVYFGILCLLSTHASPDNAQWVIAPRSCSGQERTGDLWRWGWGHQCYRLELWRSARYTDPLLGTFESVSCRAKGYILNPVRQACPHTGCSCSLWWGIPLFIFYLPQLSLFLPESYFHSFSNCLCRVWLALRFQLSCCLYSSLQKLTLGTDVSKWINNT